MLFDLPFTTYDRARELGYRVELSCSSCHHRATLDLGDPRLAGKNFAGGPRFVCSNFIKRWSATPGYVCGHPAHLMLWPTGDRAVSLGKDQGILYSTLGCGNCKPGWSFHQARRDDPNWVMLSDPRFKGYRCPGCRTKCWTGWHGHDSRPYRDHRNARSAA